MKLAVISYHTCPYEPFGSGYSGGMNVFLREVLEKISLRGWLVDIFTRSESDDFIEEKNANLKVHHIACSLPPNPSLEDFFSVKEIFSRKVASAVVKDTDALFSNYWLSAPAALHVKASMDIPLIHMHHTLEKVKEHFTGEIYPSTLLRSGRLYYEFSVQKNSDVILFPSQKDLEVSSRFYSFPLNKGAVVKPGVSDFFRQSPGQKRRRGPLGALPSKSPLFFFTGRDERTKNLKGLLKAFEEVRGEGACLVISGVEREEEDCQVVSIPQCPRKELPFHLDEADCVVVPSFYESFGLLGMESLTRGKPLIAPHDTFLGDFVKTHGAGEIFDPRLEGSLGNAMKRFLEKKDYYKDRREEISAATRPFTWENSCSQLQQILSRVC